jgi:hypothetical protein
VPTTLSLSTNARLSYSWSDSPTIGSLAESVEIKTARTITNGTGADEANVAWRDRVTIPAGQSYALNLRDLSATAFGFGGRVTLATLKEFFVVNIETAAGRYVLVATIGANDTTAYAARVNRGGDFRVADYSDGWTVTAGTTDVVHLANPTAHAVTVELGVVGVGTTADT